MNIISLEEESFYHLLNLVLERVEEKIGKPEDLWITEQEAMQLLNIKSKTTILRLRNEDAIKFSQPMHKVILYNKPSILEYLEQHSNAVIPSRKKHFLL